MRDTHITLSITAGLHNVNRVRELAPHSQILAMVKANAYGHGFDFAVQAFYGADAFGVATFEEAIALRKFSNKPLVLIEGVFSSAQWQQAQTLNASCAIYSEQQLRLALDDIRCDRPIWLKVNTGMNRLGLRPDIAYTAACQLRAAGYSLILTTHFACADEPEHPLNKQQLAQFYALKERLHPISISLCNSAALLNWPEHHGDWVRPGIMLYGASPFAMQTAADLDLKACMQLYSCILQIDWIDAGESVGYGALFTASEKCRIAIVGIGYGDGYHRATQKGQVFINEQYAPIVGRISMDLIAVDITHITCQINDVVLLWGGEALPVESAATAANTISYELLCQVTGRPARIIN